jgi:hypothetical protein
LGLKSRPGRDPDKEPLFGLKYRPGQGALLGVKISSGTRPGRDPDEEPLLGLKSRPEIPVLSGPFYPAPI